MCDDRIRGFQARTDAKLRFAKVHLEEMRKHGNPDGSDFDRAHQESFLFHLLGTRDALLVELNAYYDSPLQDQDLTPGKLRDALASTGRRSAELATLYDLEQDETSWYSIAKAMRDHAGHVSDVSRAYFVGGESHRKVKLRHPRTNELSDEHFPDSFQRWLTSMEELVLQLRGSAIAQMKARPAS